MAELHPEKNVVRLGWTSFLNDLGSEILSRLTPLFLSGVLGAPMSAIGAIEGAAETLSTLLKPVFGSLSDRSGRRKPWITAGYAISAACRPLLAWAGSWQTIAWLRALDRLGKAIRTAPRDSLIAESSLESRRGRSFGINRALDTAGAIVSLALFLLWLSRDAVRQPHLSQTTWITLCLLSLIPSLGALAVLLWGVRDARMAQKILRKDRPYAPPLGKELKRYLLIVGFFGLAASSDAFIFLRAEQLGFQLWELIGLMILLNLVSVVTTVPISRLSDRLGRKLLLTTGWGIYALAYLGFALTDDAQSMLFGCLVAFYGLFYGFTESVEKAWLADLAPPLARGKAFGALGLVTGLTALPASLGFGWLWDVWGPRAAFLTGGVIAALSLGLLLAFFQGPAQTTRRADPGP